MKKFGFFIFSIFLVLIIYYPVFGYSFFAVDDALYLIANPKVLSGLTFDSIDWALNTHFFGNWAPLQWLSLMTDVSLFGINPHYSHAISIILHYVNASLIYLFLSKILKKKLAAYIVALIFLIHPINVQPAVWISSRKDILSLFFGMLSLISYLQFINKQKIIFYLLSFIAATLGLMAKSVLISLPVILLILDLLVYKRKNYLKILIEKLPFIALSVLFIIFTTTAHGVATQLLIERPGFFRSIILGGARYLQYLGLIFFPNKLYFYYPDNFNVDNNTAIIYLFIVLIIFLLTLFYYKKSPLPLAGILIFAVALFPYLQIVKLGEHLLADRWLYFPQLGIWIASAYFLNIITSAYRLGLTTIIVISLAFLSKYQVQAWSSEQQLFTKDVSQDSSNHRAWHGLGNAYIAFNDYQNAYQNFLKAKNLHPENYAYYVSLNTVIPRLGDHRLYSTIISDQILNENTNLKTKLERGKILSLFIDNQEIANFILNKNNLTVFELSEKFLNSVIKAIPENYEAYYYLGLIYLKIKEYEKSIHWFETAYKLNPKEGSILNAIATGYLNLDHPKKALEYLHPALFYSPITSDIYKNLGNAYLKLNAFEKAAYYFKTGILTAPGSTEFYKYTAYAFLQLKDFENTKYYAEKGLKKDPNDSDLISILKQVT